MSYYKQTTSSVKASNNVCACSMDYLEKSWLIIHLVTRHQNNYTRILQLRHEAELLDSEIKTSVQLLADIRKELLATPLDAPREPAKPVPYKHLLAYAKNISPFTIPPTFRPKPPTAAEEGNKTASLSQDGANTAAGANEHAIANTPAGEGAKPSSSATDPEDTSTALKSLSADHAAWIADLNNLPFQPWPGEADMAAGALHILNHQVVNGNDPTDIARVLEEERYIAERRQAEEDEEARKRNVGHGVRPQPSARAGEEARERARFGLDDEDDDEDEDD